MSDKAEGQTKSPSKKNKKSKADRQLVKAIAMKIAKLPKAEWKTVPKDQRKSYMQAAKRAVTGIRKADRQLGLRLERRAKRAKGPKQAA